MYVAVKGGEKAIRNAHQLLAKRRRGDTSIPALTLDQIAEQLAILDERGRRVAVALGDRHQLVLEPIELRLQRRVLLEAMSGDRHEHAALDLLDCCRHVEFPVRRDHLHGLAVLVRRVDRRAVVEQQAGDFAVAVVRGDPERSCVGLWIAAGPVGPSQ